MENTDEEVKKVEEEANAPTSPEIGTEEETAEDAE